MAQVAGLSSRVDAAEAEVQRCQEAARARVAALQEQLEAAHEEIQVRLG